MDVGFIGLGNMGAGIARSLLRAGHRVTVYNRTRERAEALRKDGAGVAATVADAMEIFANFMAAYSPALSVHIGPVADRPEQTFFEFRILMEGLPARAQTNELAQGVTLKVLRLLLGAQYTPLSVHLTHDAVAPVDEYQLPVTGG